MVVVMGGGRSEWGVCELMVDGCSGLRMWEVTVGCMMHVAVWWIGCGGRPSAKQGRLLQLPFEVGCTCPLHFARGSDVERESGFEGIRKEEGL